MHRHDAGAGAPIAASGERAGGRVFVAGGSDQPLEAGVERLGPLRVQAPPDRVRLGLQLAAPPLDELLDLRVIGKWALRRRVALEEARQDGEVVIVAEELAEAVGLVGLRLEDAWPRVAEQALDVPEVL